MLQNDTVVFKLSLTCTIQGLYLDVRNVSDVIYMIQSGSGQASVRTMALPTYLGKPAYCMSQGYRFILLQDPPPTP